MGARLGRRRNSYGCVVARVSDRGVSRRGLGGVLPLPAFGHPPRVKLGEGEVRGLADRGRFGLAERTGSLFFSGFLVSVVGYGRTQSKRTNSNSRPLQTPFGVGGQRPGGAGLPPSLIRAALSKRAVSRLDWAHAQPSTVTTSRPVGAPSPRSEIWWRASIEGPWWATPPRLSPTLSEKSSERALMNPTLKGSGHPGGRKIPALKGSGHREVSAEQQGGNEEVNLWRS